MLANVIGDLLETTRQEAEAKGLAFRVDLDPSLRACLDPRLTVSALEMRVVFEPFRRVATGHTGSGLGLTIARRAVEAQGGAMSGESPTDLGRHFWFTLPKQVH